VRPVFSEAKESGDKHKVLRFLPAKKATCASCYAPVSWAPAPVLIMKRQKSGKTHKKQRRRKNTQHAQKQNANNKEKAILLRFCLMRRPHER
jgi:Na+-translocating ferredoxin:NAD+ oxidoreductase RNF subunit RnfB